MNKPSGEIVEMRPGESNVVSIRPKAGDYYRSLIASRKKYCEENGHFYSRVGTKCKMCGEDLTGKTVALRPNNILTLRKKFDADTEPNKKQKPLEDVTSCGMFEPVTPKLRITGCPAAAAET